MDISDALTRIASQKTGTLVTLRRDGSPHASVVGAAVAGEELWISVTEGRVKTQNVRHDPRVTFLAGLGPWAAIDGVARLDAADGLAARLRRYYRLLSGEHPDWDEYDAAMIEEKRLLMVIAPHRAYGFG